MKRSLYIIGGITLAISMPSHLLAQTTQPKDTTMNRTVVVEQEYNPDIMDASKVNVLPGICHYILSGNFRSGRVDESLYRKRNTTRKRPRICTCRLRQFRQSGHPRQLSIPSVEERQAECTFSNGRYGWEVDSPLHRRRKMECFLLPHTCQCGLYAPVQ